MKTLIFEKPTRDVDGLLRELRRSCPAISVGSDTRRTYVYMPDGETADPSATVQGWEDVPELRVSVTGMRMSDGAWELQANGEDVFILTIEKIDTRGEKLEGNERLYVSTKQAVPISEKRIRLEDGTASVTIGPSSEMGDVFLMIREAREKFRRVRIHLRFGSVIPIPAEEPIVGGVPETEEPRKPDEGVIAKLRRLLRF